ncbi:DMT family transporter [Maribacter polysiphoniae]|uniref:DMT family transporter n=1 Tax=Maribacter polysiphoniae TaxID=429344 RepID=A0A316DTD9_9FLAO|nr:DMT family transporter [Maribacter polysiphoniae]MBD1262164.1 DMT family transporter [Maribacter polysiphoniae]PWK21577.1 transporter family-2 protein [Maribacter polysiphoniae]
MEKYIWILLAFFAGSFLPIQSAMNNKLAKTGGSPVHASMISFAIGLLALVLYILLTSQNVSWRGIKDAPTYAWIGGILGAFYVTIIVLAFPKIGPGLTFGLVVTGQLLISMLMEHFYIMGAQQIPISIGRIVGMILIIGGVIIMKKF